MAQPPWRCTQSRLATRAEELEREAYRGELMRYFRRALKVIRNRIYSRSLVELSSQAQFLQAFWRIFPSSMHDWMTNVANVDPFDANNPLDVEEIAVG